VRRQRADKEAEKGRARLEDLKKEGEKEKKDTPSTAWVPTRAARIVVKRIRKKERK